MCSQIRLKDYLFHEPITLLPDVNQDGVSRCPFSTAAINVFILLFQLFVILSSPGEDQFCFFFRAFKYHLLCDLYFIFTELLYLSRRFVSSPPGKLFTRVLPYRPPKFFKINLCCCCDLLFIIIIYFYPDSQK